MLNLLMKLVLILVISLLVWYVYELIKPKVVQKIDKLLQNYLKINPDNKSDND